MTPTQKLKAKLLAKKQDAPVPAGDFLSSGSTLLNLAATGRTNGCFTKGRYFWLVGDSTSGKTFLALTCFAERFLNSSFKDYRIIFDDAEDGALMDKTKFFGPEVAKCIESPAHDKNGPVFSSTIEEFYYHLDDAFKAGKPFIYVLDSMDAISDSAEQDKFQQRKRADRAGKDTSGSFGTAKAKANSANLRVMRAKLQKSGSILIIISQTRDNIGFGSQYNPKVASGGRALKFYATLEIWTSVREHIKRTVRGKSRELGIVARVHIKKNRITGRDRTVDIPIFHSYGIDDLGSMVDWLVSEEVWEENKGVITASGFMPGTHRLNELIRGIEEDDRQKELKGIVAAAWNEIEAACTISRKSPYTSNGESE